VALLEQLFVSGRNVVQYWFARVSIRLFVLTILLLWAASATFPRIAEGRVHAVLKFVYAKSQW
jgi:hypothetical protein